MMDGATPVIEGELKDKTEEGIHHMMSHWQQVICMYLACRNGIPPGFLAPLAGGKSCTHSCWSQAAKQHQQQFNISSFTGSAGQASETASILVAPMVPLSQVCLTPYSLHHTPVPLLEHGTDTFG